MMTAMTSATAALRGRRDASRGMALLLALLLALPLLLLL
jgi:hypothetical protein